MHRPMSYLTITTTVSSSPTFTTSMIILDFLQAIQTYLSTHVNDNQVESVYTLNDDNNTTKLIQQSISTTSQQVNKSTSDKTSRYIGCTNTIITIITIILLTRTTTHVTHFLDASCTHIDTELLSAVTHKIHTSY